MSEQNNRQEEFFQDEREIEISDLPEDAPAVQNISASRVRKISLRARYTPRQRKRQAIITASIVLVALIVFLASMFPFQSLYSQFIQSDAKPLASGDNLFYFPALPSWGTFALDGKPLKTAPRADSGPPIGLPRGTHTLEWRGEPFSSLQCTLVVPPLPDQQTCITRSSGSNEYTKNAWIVDFPTSPSLQQLSQSERSVLINTLQNLLNGLGSGEIVQPGERYSYQQKGHVYTANERLQATQRFVLDTNISDPANCQGPRFGTGCSRGNNDCRLLCSLDWPMKADDPKMQGWHIAAVVRQNWTYAPLNKQAQTTPKGVDTLGDQYLVTFQVTREQKQWRATFHPQGSSPFDDPNCIGLVGQITSSDVYQQLDETQQRLTWTFSSGSNRASGCLATALLHGGSSLQLPASSDSNVYLLYRFNQLQAVNPLARQLWPTLPLANQHEEDIAMQIANHAVFVS